MFSKLSLSLLCLFSAAAWSSPRWTVGTGLDIRLQKEVNPDFVEVQSLGQLFAQMQFDRFGAHVEVGSEKQSSNSGGLVIESRSLNAGLWGRYQFLPENRWKPFVSTGVGSYFDRVKSEFSGASDTRNGRRPYWGLGGGMNVIFWEHFFTEAEGRVSLVRDRKEPMISALLRVGFSF